MTIITVILFGKVLSRRHGTGGKIVERDFTYLKKTVEKRLQPYADCAEVIVRNVIRIGIGVNKKCIYGQRNIFRNS